MPLSLKDELAASKMYVDLLEKAEETRRYYQSLRLPLPDALRRLVGNNGSGEGSDSTSGFTLPLMPSDAQDDWAWIPLGESSPVTLIRALLKVAPSPLKSKELYEQANATGINASLGTISNAAVRLETQEIIARNADGAWLIAKPDQAGTIFEGYVWGPPSIFTVQELAAHRREAILKILRKWSGGLQTAQIIEQLRQLDWLRAPVNKDLIKADIDKLQGENKVRRALGHSRKWVLVEETNS